MNIRFKTAPEHKLLGLYLMDSIIKNLRETNYLQLFQDRIVKLFVNVFESVCVLCNNNNT